MNNLESGLCLTSFLVSHRSDERCQISFSEVAVAYSDSPLNARSANVHRGPEPGKRAPIREGEPDVGSGNTPRFGLFDPTATSPSPRNTTPGTRWRRI